MKITTATVNPLYQGHVDLQQPNETTGYITGASLEHAKAIAYVINHPEFADIVINEKAIEYAETLEHNRKFYK